MTSPPLSTVPLIDRQAELRRLMTMIGEALETGSGRLITVVGPRGVGKTRVVNTFADWCGQQQMTVLSAQCVGRAAEPLLPIRDALRPVLGSNSRAVRAALRRSAPDLLQGVPVIGKFLASFGRELSTGPEIGGNNPRGLYDLLASVIVKLGSRSGLCMVIEDAHMADLETLSFLTYLAGKSRACPALLVVTLPAEERQGETIAEYLSEWAEKGFETLTIGPLQRADVGEFLAAALGQVSVEESVLDLMFGFTGGNPLLLGESVRELVDAHGAAVGMPADTTEIPERIRALLQRRLERLDGQTRAFVDAAAVAGQTSQELAPILHLLGVDNRSGLASLAAASEAGVLAEAEDGRISFTSEMFQIVTYGLLRPNERRSLHLSAGEWFDQEQQYSEAAHHYQRAEDWERFRLAAFGAAEAAEHVGLYQTAVSWYRRLEGKADPDELSRRLARALLVVGDWAEAEQLVESLPSNDSETLMLRSRLSFVRGDVTGAAGYANRALVDSAGADIGVLIYLANIHLYGGEFARATEYAERALETAQASGSIDDRARCHIVRGACWLHTGDPGAAERSFQNGIRLLNSRPEGSRDAGVYSALLGNRGYIEELGQRWAEAEASHGEALRLRQQVADAVGVLETTLALGRVALGQDKLESAEEQLSAALRLAEDLGEELQQAKVIHARGELAARTGDVETARQLVEDARGRFAKCGTPYDVAYAGLSLATILAPTRPREAVERLATARAAVEQHGFALLQRLFPQLQPALPERIHAGLLAYAGADALGLPWEGTPPQDIQLDQLESLPARGTWPSGATSDDTALTLLVAEHLAGAGGPGDPLQFLRTLAGQAGSIKGLGPSTTRAIEHFTATGEPDDSGADTNGAPMRALPIGWAVPASADERRREWTLALTRLTHTGPEALTGACVMSACASWAIEGAPPDLLVEIAGQEAAAVGAGTEVARAIAAVAERQWRSPVGGISLAPSETVAAVLHCCHATDGDLIAALRLAVSLGGDTDTVAALVGGLLGSRLAPADVRARLGWLDRTDLPAPEQLSRLGSALAAIRLAGDE